MEIYTRDWCGYCVRAKALLNELGVAFTEYEAGMDPALRQEMVTRSGGVTFPQILINDRPIGGSDDLHALHASGKLEQMLAEEGA
ncbi:MAG: glutaredoxin 3 [Hyphomonadaceae bacterium]